MDSNFFGGGTHVPGTNDKSSGPSVCNSEWD